MKNTEEGHWVLKKHIYSNRTPIYFKLFYIDYFK